MPVTGFHALTATTPDDVLYEIRPQAHWNAAHVLSMEAAGSEISGAFSNANGVSFGLSAGQVTASHNGLTTAAQSNQVVNSLNGSTGAMTIAAASSLSLATAAGVISLGLASDITTALQSAGAYLTTQSAQAFSAPGGSSNFQTLNFANSNGVSFSNSNGSVVATVATTYAGSNHSHGDPTLALTNLSGTTASASNGLTISLSAAAPGGGANFSAGVSGGNTAGDTGVTGTRLVFAGGNNITLSQVTDANGASITVSGANLGGAQTGISGIVVSDTTYTSGTVSFSNANGISFGSSAGQAITASYTVPAATVFSNSNNVTFGLNGSTVTATATFAQSNQAFSAPGGSSAFQTLVFANSQGVSWSNSNGSVVATVATTYAGSNHSHGDPTLALTNLSGTTASNSNGLTLSLSAAAPGGGALTVSDNATSLSVSRLAFTQSNGITMSLSTEAGGATVIASHNGLTSQSNQAFSADASSTFQTLSFQDSNGVSFSNNGGALRVTHALQFTSATSAITSAALHTSASRVMNVIAATNSTAGGAASLSSNVSFSAANGVTFYTSAGNAIVGSVVTSYRASNDALGTATAASNVTWTANSAGVSLDARGYAGTATAVTGAASITLNSGGLSFNGAGLAGTSSGFTGANISATITHNTAGLAMSMSVAAPGAAAEQNAVNLLGANTAGNTTATGSTIGFSGLNLTLSGTNASQIVFSAPATSSLSATGQLSISTNGSTISIGVPNKVTLSGYLNDFLDREMLLGQIGNNQLFVQPLDLVDAIQFDRINWVNNFTATSNSSGSITLSLNVGIYTRNVSTLSLLTNFTNTLAATMSGTVGSYSLYGGMRHCEIPGTTTLSDGNYWIGFLSRTTTGGAAGMTVSNYVGSNINVALSGKWGSAVNATNQHALGMGSFNTTTTAMPASLAFSAINGSAAVNLRPVMYQFVSQSI